MSVQHYKESSQWIQDNVCRNLSRAISLGCVNCINQRHAVITFHYKNDSRAEKRCNRIYSYLKEQNAVIYKMCTSKPEPQLVGFLTVNELKMVRKFALFEYISALSTIISCMQVCHRHHARITDNIRIFSDKILSTDGDLILLGLPHIDKGVNKPLSAKTGVIRVKIGTTVYTTDKFDIIIDCNVYKGIPPITFHWYHNNILDQSRGNVSSITIPVTDAADIDRDVYTCKAENAIGCDVMNTTIYYVKNKFCIIP